MITVKISSASFIVQLYKSSLNHDHIFQNQTLILQECVVFCRSGFAHTASADANFMFLYSALNEISNTYWYINFFTIKRK